jgi:hypothetical protein
MLLYSTSRYQQYCRNLLELKRSDRVVLRCITCARILQYRRSLYNTEFVSETV